MTGLIIGALLVVGLFLFLRKAAFLPGGSQGVPSPDGAFVAMFGTRSERKPFAQRRLSHEVTVEMTIAGGSLQLFKFSIDQSAALHDLRTKGITDIVRWDADSAKVTFVVTRQPIVINVKELASKPEIQRIVEMRRQQASGR